MVIRFKKKKKKKRKIPTFPLMARQRGPHLIKKLYPKLHVAKDFFRLYSEWSTTIDANTFHSFPIFAGGPRFDTSFDKGYLVSQT